MTRRNLIMFSAIAVGFMISLAIVAKASGVTVRIGAADASYYPRVLMVAQTASLSDRERLLSLWASQTPGGYYGFITSLELHHVLWHMNYCTNLVSWPGCKSLPVGSEAQGIAKEMLDQLSDPYRK